MLYLWLLLTVVLVALSRGEVPVESAVWLAPVFLLRVTRSAESRGVVALVIPALALGHVIGTWGMSILPFWILLPLALIGAVLILLPYLLDRWLHGRLGTFARSLVLPASMVLLHWLIQQTPIGGPRNPAHALHNDLALLQLAALTGAWGIIFLMTWTASVANAWWESDFRIRPIATLLVAYGAAMVATYGFGEVRLRYTETPEQTIRVAGITASESQRQRQFDVFEPVLLEGQPLTAEVAVQSGQLGMGVARELLSESERQAEAGAELVVWSEAAIVIRAEDEPALLEMAGDVAAKHGVLLGITPVVLEPEAPSLFAERKPYNRIKLVLIDRYGKVAWQVSKTKLVVPIESASSVAGDGQFPVVETGVGPVAGAICFDLDHPSMIRRSRFGAPRIFLAPSNDWEAITAYHSRPHRLRAIENGFALLRPTSQGRSIATDAYGRIVALVDFHASGGAPLVAELPVSEVRTLYSWLGDWFAYLCLVMTLALVFLGLRAGKRGRVP